jgi:hypothetical protein
MDCRGVSAKELFRGSHNGFGHCLAIRAAQANAKAAL